MEWTRALGAGSTPHSAQKREKDQWQTWGWILAQQQLPRRKLPLPHPLSALTLQMQETTSARVGSADPSERASSAPWIATGELAHRAVLLAVASLSPSHSSRSPPTGSTQDPPQERLPLRAGRCPASPGRGLSQLPSSKTPKMFSSTCSPPKGNLLSPSEGLRTQIKLSKETIGPRAGTQHPVTRCLGQQTSKKPSSPPRARWARRAPRACAGQWGGELTQSYIPEPDLSLN